MNGRGNAQAKRRIRKARSRRSNRGIKATLHSLLTLDRQFDRNEADLETLDGTVRAKLLENESSNYLGLYRDPSFERAELDLFSELMRIALVTDSAGKGLKRAQRVALHQLGTIVDFIEIRGGLGPDIDPLRLLRSNLADLLKGDRAPFFSVRSTQPANNAGRKVSPEYGRELQYLSTLAVQAMKDARACKTITKAAEEVASVLDDHKVRQIDGHDGALAAKRAISSSRLLKWREEVSDDPSYKELRATAIASTGWPKTPDDAKMFLERTAKRLARIQWWTNRSERGD